jgi:hypothetical protein
MDKNISTQLENISTETYQGVQVMRSTDLHKFIVNLTGKYEKLKTFHRKVREVLKNQLGTKSVPAQLLPNGHIKYYRLNEVQCNMVMASIDINHLQTLAEFWVSNKSNTLTTTPTVVMTKEDEVMLPVYEARKASALRKLALEDEEIEKAHKSRLKEIALADKQIEDRHKNVMKEIAIESKAIKQREYVLVDGMKVKADMTVGKIDPPYESLTALLKKHGRKEHAHEINVILNYMGYVEYVNRVYILTDSAAYYGKNLKSGNTLTPKYYVDYFEELLEEIDSYVSKY